MIYVPVNTRTAHSRNAPPLWPPSTLSVRTCRVRFSGPRSVRDPPFCLVARARPPFGPSSTTKAPPSPRYPMADVALCVRRGSAEASSLASIAPRLPARHLHPYLLRPGSSTLPFSSPAPTPPRPPAPASHPATWTCTARPASTPASHSSCARPRPKSH